MLASLLSFSCCFGRHEGSWRRSRWISVPVPLMEAIGRGLHSLVMRDLGPGDGGPGAWWWVIGVLMMGDLGLVRGTDDGRYGMGPGDGGSGAWWWRIGVLMMGDLGFGEGDLGTDDGRLGVLTGESDSESGGLMTPVAWQWDIYGLVMVDPGPIDQWVGWWWGQGRGR